jgi:hypothetical protein
MAGKRMIRILAVMIMAGAVFCFAGNWKQTYSPDALEKALDIVRRIEEAGMEGSAAESRKAKVTEEVLNAYLAYRAELDGGPLKNLEVKLFPENIIEGKLYIDLRGANPPKGLKPEMTFYFRSKIEIQEGKGRLDIKELFLEKQQVEPLILDLAIFFISKMQNTEASGISDWYLLPYGITNIKTYKGWGEIYY